MRKALLLLLGLLLIGILSYFCFMDKSTEIKEDLISKTEASYKDGGLQGIKVGLKGEGLKQTRIITLDGEVASDTIKEKAEKIASNIDGVAGVDNNLIVNSSMALVDTSNNATNAKDVIDESEKEKASSKEENENSSATNKDSVESEKENSSSLDTNIEKEKASSKEENEKSNETNKNSLESQKENSSSLDTNIEKEKASSKEENENSGATNKDSVESEKENGSFLDTNKEKEKASSKEENEKSNETNKNSLESQKENDSSKILDNNIIDKDKNSNTTETLSKNGNIKSDNTQISKNENKSNISTCQSKFKELLGDNKIHFAYNKATIRSKSYPLLNKLIEAIKSCPNEVIIIEGHTDSDGNEAYNQRLSEKRANAVKQYLIKHGIRASRLKAIGYGEKRPIADNRTEEGKEKNRRIEFKIKGVK